MDKNNFYMYNFLSTKIYVMTIRRLVDGGGAASCKISIRVLVIVPESVTVSHVMFPLGKEGADKAPSTILPIECPLYSGVREDPLMV